MISLNCHQFFPQKFPLFLGHKNGMLNFFSFVTKCTIFLVWIKTIISITLENKKGPYQDQIFCELF